MVCMSTAHVLLAPKFRESFVGPVVVTNKLTDLNYEIQISPKKDRQVVHHNKKNPYHVDTIPTWGIHKSMCKKIKSKK